MLLAYSLVSLDDINHHSPRYLSDLILWIRRTWRLTSSLCLISCSVRAVTLRIYQSKSASTNIMDMKYAVEEIILTCDLTLWVKFWTIVKSWCLHLKGDCGVDNVMVVDFRQDSTVSLAHRSDHFPIKIFVKFWNHSYFPDIGFSFSKPLVNFCNHFDFPDIMWPFLQAHISVVTHVFMWCLVSSCVHLFLDLLKQTCSVLNVLKIWKLSVFEMTACENQGLIGK